MTTQRPRSRLRHQVEGQRFVFDSFDVTFFRNLPVCRLGDGRKNYLGFFQGLVGCGVRDTSPALLASPRGDPHAE